MSDISLRAYVDYIQDRLERDAFSEVVAQCRHVLQSRPKYIEVYKLLARALLEQENYQDATDLFQRVLSADPNDFVAHIGISECYHESAAIDQAIWHLERAFEQVPSNVDLQEEIKRLYTERDGSAPRRIQLTAGALARLYLNGQLYPQAILELRKAVEVDPNRPDLQVLLAEALWQNHQEVEAGELAASVLKRLPNSLDANRILAKLWLRAGQPDEAAPFLERLEELDPYLAYSVRHDGQPAPAEAFRLPMLEYTTERHASEVGAAEWVSQIQSVEKVPSATAPLAGPAAGHDAGHDAAPAAPSGSVPDWLQGAYAAGLENAPEEDTPVVPLQAPTAAADPAPPEDTGGLGWLPELLGGSSESADDDDGDETPDWLSDILRDTSPLDSQETPAEPPAPADDEVDDELGDEEPRPSTDPLTRPAPDWLADALGEASAAPSTPVVETAGEDEPEAPDWLDDILSGRDLPAGPGDEATGEPTPGVVSTDWLDGLIGGAAESTPSGDLLEEEAASEWPAPKDDPTGSIIDFGELEPWDTDPLPEDPLATRLLDTAAPEADDTPPGDAGPVAGIQSEPDVSAEDEALPAWLRPEVADEHAPALREEQQVTLPNDDPMGEDSSQDVPDWLSDGDLDNSDAAIDWLEELAAKYDPGFESSQADDAEPAGEGEAEPEELPDWLAGTSERAAEEPLPSWLLDEGDEELVESPEAQIEVEPEEEGFPDWLTGAPAPAAEAAADEEEEAFSFEFEDEEEEKPAAEPSWSRTVSELDDEEEQLPDWLGRAPSYQTASAAGDEEEEDSLDWLTGSPATEAEPEPVEEAGEEEEEIPAWLSGKPAEPVAPAASEPAAADEEEIPEWLKRRTRGYEEEEDDLAWLDRQVEAQGVSPDEPLAEALTADQPPVSAPEPVGEDEEAEPVAEGEMPSWFKDIEAREDVEAVSEETAEDLDAELLEAAALDASLDDLSWLDSALEAEEITVSEDDFESLFGEIEDVRGEIPAVEEPEVEAEAEAEPVAAVEEAPEAEAEAAEAEEEAPLAASATMPDWLTPAPAAPAEAEVEEVAEEAEPAEAEAAAEAEEAEPEMPDWLKEAAAPVAETEETVEDLVKAEAVEEPEPEMPDWLKEAVAPAAEVEVAVEAEVAEPVAEAAPAVSADERLSTAREKLPLDFGEAVPIYEGLIAEGEKLEQTVADLDYYLRSTPKPDPRARRVLGDAYREQGKLQEALDAYRAALDEL